MVYQVCIFEPRRTCLWLGRWFERCPPMCIFRQEGDWFGYAKQRIEWSDPFWDWLYDRWDARKTIAAESTSRYTQNMIHSHYFSVWKIWQEFTFRSISWQAQFHLRWLFWQSWENSTWTEIQCVGRCLTMTTTNRLWTWSMPLLTTPFFLISWFRCSQKNPWGH